MEAREPYTAVYTSISSKNAEADKATSFVLKCVLDR